MVEIKNGKFKIEDNRHFKGFLDKVATKSAKLFLIEKGEKSIDDIYGVSYFGPESDYAEYRYAFVGNISQILDFGVFCAQKMNKRGYKKKGGFNRVDEVRVGEYQGQLTNLRFTWTKA